MKHGIDKHEYPGTDWGVSHSKKILGTAMN